MTGLRVFHRGGTEQVTAPRPARSWCCAASTPPPSATSSAPAPATTACSSPGPASATVVEPLDEADRPALYAALTRLAEQDPLIALRQDDERREVHLSLYGEVQQQVIGSLLAEEYGVDVRFRDTAMICIERVRGTGAAYELIGTATPTPTWPRSGCAWSPLRSGPASTSAWRSSSGRCRRRSSPRSSRRWRPRSAKAPHGWEVPDARVRMTHSGYSRARATAHGTFDKSMSSTAGDFRHLASLMLARALARAGTVVCTPVHRFELEVPASTLGRCSRCSRASAPSRSRPSRAAASVVLTGDVPADAVHRLTLQVPGVTRGEGALTTRLDHYRPVTGRPPRRPHLGADPYDREEYLAGSPADRPMLGFHGARSASAATVNLPWPSPTAAGRKEPSWPCEPSAARPS